MRFSLILLGLIFVFSPDITLFDLLPDVIGWFFITLGLTPLADIEMRGEEAKRLSLRMMLISGVKLAVSLFTFRFSTSDMLLATFAYGIVEIITVIPFVTNLFTALDYSAMRITPSLDSDKVSGVKWYMYVFFVLKNVLAFLPATVGLFDTEATGNLSADTWFVDFEAAMRVFMVFAFFLSAVISLVSLIYVGQFFLSLIKNKELKANMMKHRRDEVLSKENVMTVKNTSFVLTFFLSSMLFFFDFYVDALDVLPTFVGFLLVFSTSVFMKTRMKRNCIVLTILSFVGLLTSLFSFLYRLYWGEKTSFVLTYSFGEKPLTLPLGVITAVLSALVIILILKEAKDFNEKYTKYKIDDNVALLMTGGAVESFFGVMLYAFPSLNTTFVFPSIVFGVAYTALTLNFFFKLKRQISKDMR